MEAFHVEDYLKQEKETAGAQKRDFGKLCQLVLETFRREWDEGQENMQTALEIQKKAMIGFEKEVNYFKGKIREALKKYGGEVKCPGWYESLEDGIYHENWGMSGIAEWFGKAYANSSSAKVIGDRIYFLEGGRMILKEQRISKERREQLIRTLLLLTPRERLNKDFHEVYMLDGTRVTIFGGNMVKPGEDVIIFRRYVVPNYTFEEQAARGTIPREGVELFKAMVPLGYNVAFTGAVRTAKTTFLSTWQSYEDENLEGVMVETDPEVPLHRLMPSSPIVQVLADGDALRNISKSLLRSDADYVIMAEARDGVALDAAIKLASKGTRRMKITFHARDPMSFPYDVAGEIVKSMGGDIHFTAQRVAASFDYIFHFVQLKDKAQKRLKSIHEIALDRTSDRIVIRPICEYRYDTDDWRWYDVMDDGIRRAGMEEDSKAFARFAGMLGKWGARS